MDVLESRGRRIKMSWRREERFEEERFHEERYQDERLH